MGLDNIPVYGQQHTLHAQIDIETRTTRDAPEPSAMLLLGSGFCALTARVRRQRRSLAYSEAVGKFRASGDGSGPPVRCHRVKLRHLLLNAAKNVPGLENLTNLDKLPARGALVVALPLKIEGGSGGPLRAIALVPR